MAGAGIQDIAERLQGTAAEEWARKAAAGDAEAQWQLHQSLAYSDSGYFLNRFCWIRDFQEGWEKPFEEREIQAVLRKACLTENYVVGLKAREIGWTWVLALLCLWESWRFAPYQCIYLAQRKDNARQFISRIRFAAEKLPPELGFPTETKPKTQLRFAFTNSLGQESEILAFPSVPSSLQSWHPRRVIADEWGLINEPVLPAALGAVGLRGYFVGLGTAEGLDNEHAQVYISCRDGYGDLYAPKGKKFHHVFGSWMDNPDFHVRPSGGTERDTERMYPENDQQAFALTFGGQPVYPEFNMGLHVAKENIQAERGRPLIRGWDFGNTPACVVFQLQTSGKICILREFQSLNPGITEFGTLVRDECNMEWPDSIWQDWGDPSGDIPRETDGKTCFEHLLKLGIRCKGGRANFTERRESVANRLTRLVDGEPSLLVSPRCQIMIQGFAGGYRFPPHTDEEAYDAFRRQRESGRARLRGRVGDA